MGGLVCNCDMKLGEKILAGIAAKRWSQSDLARATGLNPTTVSRAVNGEGKLYLEQARRIAEALGVSLDYLADDSLDAPPTGPELTEQEAYILSTARRLGYDVAERRLLGLFEVKPGSSPLSPPSP